MRCEFWTGIIRRLFAAGFGVGEIMKSLNVRFARLGQSKLALVGGALLVAGAARATDIDTTAVVAVITGGVTTISAIGIAVLSLVVVIKLFKWVQRVL